MSTTRKSPRKSRGSRSSPDVSPSESHITTTPSSFPDVPGAAKKDLAPVSPPGSKVPFHRFVHVAVLGATLLLVLYTYSMASLLHQDAAWWRLLLSLPAKVGSNIWDSENRVRVVEGETLEGRMNALADVLNVPARDVASAVKPLVPPASLASMVPQMQESEMSEVWRVLMENKDERSGQWSRPSGS